MEGGCRAPSASICWPRTPRLSPFFCVLCAAGFATIVRACAAAALPVELLAGWRASLLIGVLAIVMARCCRTAVRAACFSGHAARGLPCRQPLFLPSYMLLWAAFWVPACRSLAGAASGLWRRSGPLGFLAILASPHFVLCTLCMERWQLRAALNATALGGAHEMLCHLQRCMAHLLQNEFGGWPLEAARQALHLVSPQVWRKCRDGRAATCKRVRPPRFCWLGPTLCCTLTALEDYANHSVTPTLTLHHLPSGRARGSSRTMCPCT